MDYNIGDTVRIIEDPSASYDGGDYEIGDIATVEAIELNNGRIWYELDIEIFDSDQVVWSADNLELVRATDKPSVYRPGDTVILNVEGKPTTATVGYVQLEELPDEGEQFIYYMLKNERPDISKGYTAVVLQPEAPYTLF